MVTRFLSSPRNFLVRLRATMHDAQAKRMWQSSSVMTLALASLGAMKAFGFSTPLNARHHSHSSGMLPALMSEPRGVTALGSGGDAVVPLEHNFTVTFPGLPELEDMRRGDILASSGLQAQGHEFRVVLCPRAAGRGSFETIQDRKGGREDAAFALGRKEDAVNDRVGVYLQYVAKSQEDTVDATFSLRLKGRQSAGPRFDVETTSGMRFVSADRANLKSGTSNDCGAHVMQSFLLEDFLGGEGSKEQLDIEVKVKIYPSNDESQLVNASGESGPLSFADIRETADSDVHNAGSVRVGKAVVPVLRGLSQRTRMMELGAYPGVEYRITRILHPTTGEDLFCSVPDADYELRPLYPLVPRLERQWPVRVNEKDIPKLLTMNKYNALYAAGSLVTAATGLAAAFVLSQLLSLFFIPSKSMDPTLLVGDVLVVEKVTSRLKLKDPSVGDVVLFNPNSKLQGIVKASGGRISDRDLFVKRVAAGPGDKVSVDRTGSVLVNDSPASGKRDLCDEEPLRLIEQYVTQVDNLEIQKDDVFVLGDCSSVSVDSRVWGPLNKKDLVGTPLLRTWPPARIGSVPAIPSSEQIH